MINREHEKISYIQIDDMVLGLLSGCHKVEYADAASHFYQLALQTLETAPNIVGPLKPPTGKTLLNRANGKSFNITKTVLVPQEVNVSIWVVRGYFPDTGVPFKMTVWRNSAESYGGGAGAKVVMGTFADRTKWHHINCRQIRKYAEEVAERTILSQPTDDIDKPTKEERLYKCMSPKGLPLQKKTKHEQKKVPRRKNNKKPTDNGRETSSSISF